MEKQKQRQIDKIELDYGENDRWLRIVPRLEEAD